MNDVTVIEDGICIILERMKYFPQKNFEIIFEIFFLKKSKKFQKKIMKKNFEQFFEKKFEIFFEKKN